MIRVTSRSVKVTMHCYVHLGQIRRRLGYLDDVS